MHINSKKFRFDFALTKLVFVVPPSQAVCQYTNDLSLTLGFREEFRCSSANGKDFLMFCLFYLFIYPPDSQESDGGANVSMAISQYSVCIYGYLAGMQCMYDFSLKHKLSIKVSQRNVCFDL